MVGGEIIRRYENLDVEPLHRAIQESREHLRPWMAWASDQLPTRAEREAVFAEWNAEPRGITYGVFDSDSRVLAGSGLHDRGGPTDIEIGYWVHASATGQGLATRIAQTLTSVAFDSESSLLCVRIKHDAANVTSGRIPARLGYQRVAVDAEEPDANGTSRELWTWEMTRALWVA